MSITLHLDNHRIIINKRKKSPGPDSDYDLFLSVGNPDTLAATLAEARTLATAIEQLAAWHRLDKPSLIEMSVDGHRIMVGKRDQTVHFRMGVEDLLLDDPQAITLATAIREEIGR